MKQRIVMIVVFAITLSVANFAARFLADRFGSCGANEIAFTAGLDEMPVVYVPVRILDVVLLGYMERADQRSHLLLTGRISPGVAQKAKLFDLILSVAGLACVALFSKWASRKISG
jgi:hypothetical protein